MRFTVNIKDKSGEKKEDEVRAEWRDFRSTSLPAKFKPAL